MKKEYIFATVFLAISVKYLGFQLFTDEGVNFIAMIVGVTAFVVGLGQLLLARKTRGQLDRTHADDHADESSPGE